MGTRVFYPNGSLRDGDDPVLVTPESAGWTYSGLRVVELGPGASRTFATGGTEMAALPLGGSFTVECEGHRFELRGRDDVFARVTDFAYLPIDAEARITSAGGGRIALPSARARRRLDPAYGPAEEVPSEVRGAGQASRQINNFLSPDGFPADELIAVEVLTPEGNWSSYPPHKHDEIREGEAQLEEIYYFEVAGDQGFALHRLYTADREIDATEEVRSGDVFLIPRGYHGPSVAAPGYHLYYLNVLGGPNAERTMAFCTDPAHAWLWQAWEGVPKDARLPLTTHETRSP